MITEESELESMDPDQLDRLSDECFQTSLEESAECRRKLRELQQKHEKSLRKEVETPLMLQGVAAENVCRVGSFVRLTGTMMLISYGMLKGLTHLEGHLSQSASLRLSM